MIRLPPSALAAPGWLIALTLVLAVLGGLGVVAGVAAAVRPDGIATAVPATPPRPQPPQSAEANPEPSNSPVDQAEADPSADLPATLMLTAEEAAGINSAIAAGPLARTRGPALPAGNLPRTAPRQTAPLYVSGIVYHGPGAWTVWINGVPFSPGQTAGQVEIESVTASTVRLSVPWGDEGRKAIQMAANQTFLPRLGNVVEGHVAR